MNRLRISYDRHARNWLLANADGPGLVKAGRMVLDAPAKLTSQGYVECEAVMQADDVTSLTGAHDAAVRRVHVRRAVQQPDGRVNTDTMLGWNVFWDETRGEWVANVGDSFVRAREMELDCVAVCFDGVLRCTAEMLLEGRSHKKGSVPRASSVKLRTLIVHDQAIQIQPIGIGGNSVRP